MRPQKAAEWIAHEALKEIVLGEVSRRTSVASGGFFGAGRWDTHGNRLCRSV
jgi:hypothetical protein